MQDETTPSEDHSDVVEETTPDVDVEAGSDEGKTPEEPNTDGKRELDPEEMQKTMNRALNEVNDLKKDLEEVKRRPSGDGNADKIQELSDKLNQAEFYRKNPEYDVPAIKAALGVNPDESIKDESMKDLIDAKIAQVEAEKSKSVMQSNSRLGQVRNKMDDAVKAANDGNHDAARSGAVGAVLDAFEK